MNTENLKIASAPTVEPPAISPAVATPPPALKRTASGKFAPKNGTVKTAKPAGGATEAAAPNGDSAVKVGFWKSWPGKILMLGVGAWFVARIFSDNSEKKEKEEKIPTAGNKITAEEWVKS